MFFPKVIITPMRESLIRSQYRVHLLEQRVGTHYRAYLVQVDLLDPWQKDPAPEDSLVFPPIEGNILGAVDVYHKVCHDLTVGIDPEKGAGPMLKQILGSTINNHQAVAGLFETMRLGLEDGYYKLNHDESMPVVQVNSNV